MSQRAAFNRSSKCWHTHRGVHSTHSAKTGAVKEGANQSSGDVKVNGGAVGEWAKIHNVTWVTTDLSHGRITDINDVARSGVHGNDAGLTKKD